MKSEENNMFLCETCVKSDVCKYMEEMEKAFKQINEVTKDKEYVKFDLSCNHKISKSAAIGIK